MDKDKIDLDEVEKNCREFIRMVLLTSESELHKHSDGIKALPFAALAVRESILTFLALIHSK